jgi:hypothetical protein
MKERERERRYLKEREKLDSLKKVIQINTSGQKCDKERKR